MYLGIYLHSISYILPVSSTSNKLQAKHSRNEEGRQAQAAILNQHYFISETVYQLPPEIHSS